MMHKIEERISFQKQELEGRFKEKYVERIKDTKKMDYPLVKVIMGPRKSGKSFFTIHYLKKHGNFGYANFDDEQLILSKDYNEIVYAIKKVYDNPKIIFFDEIQNLPRWELFVNRLQREGYNLIISGSNANLLSRELATHLTGRHIPLYLFPFSFKEFHNMQDKDIPTIEILKNLNEYLISGGYPEPIIKRIDFKDYLKTLFDSIIYKDIVQRYNIKLAKEIDNLAIYLLSNIASEYSYNSISKNISVKSSNTIKKYMEYLEETFLFFSVPKFSYKVREQVSSNKKIYCIDNGLIISKGFQFKNNFGKLYENLVAYELIKKQYEGESDVYYWKNQQSQEVDFVLKKGIKIDQLIQVSYDLSKKETYDREIRGLINASKELKCNNLIIINSEIEKEEEVTWFETKRKIKFIPLWKWLLKISIKK